MRPRQTLAVLLVGSLLTSGFTLAPAVGTAAHASAVPRAGHRSATVLASDTTLRATPERVRPGRQVIANGTGFAPHESVVFLINGVSRIIGVTQANGRGAFAGMAVTIPANVAIGAHVLTAQGGESKRTAQTSVAVVNRTVTVTPTRVAPGGVVTVTASGFEPSSDLNVTISGHAGSIGVVRSDGNGGVPPTRVDIPTTVSFGAHTLSVVNTGTHLGASTSINVESTVTVTPTTVAPGGVVTVTALGFEPNADLTVLVSGYAGSVAVVRSNTSGVVPPTRVTVPRAVPFGEHALSVVNTAAHRGASTKINIASTVSVTPTMVAPGSVVTLTAAGFAPNSNLNVLLSGYAGSIAIVHSDATGMVAPTHVTIPIDAPTGAHTLSVVNTAEHRGASARIAIGATVSVTPTTVRAGSAVTVTAAGFAPNATLNVLFSGQAGSIGIVRSNSDGTVPPTRITVPASTLAGIHTLSVVNTGTHSGASARLTVEAAAPTPTPVTATLAVTPTTTNRGGVVTVSGTGYTPGETVDLALSGTTAVTSTAKADASGNLPATGLSIPYSVKDGTYTITATGATSKRASSAQVVVAPLHPVITLSAAAASPAMTVTVSGTGFGREEQVTLALNGQALVTAPKVITTTNGAFTASFAVPHSLLQGANTVSAVGNESRVTAVAALTGNLPQSARYYFAGGMNSATDHSFVQILNTHNQPASVQLTFYFQNGTPVTRPVNVPAHAQSAVSVASFGLPVGTFGLALTSDRQVTAQLTINRDGKDGDTLLGNTGLGTRWYLAEGYTGLTFHESVSILNPGTTLAHVELQLLPFGGRTGKTVVVTVPAQSNLVTDVNALLPGQSLSIIANSDRPVVVERTLTFSTGGYGLTTRAGTNNAATTWLFAEGTTVNRFQTFLTILNPNALPATVTASFFSRTGTSLGSKTIVVSGRSRANIKLNDLLTASGVASVVTSNEDVVVERPEYFGSPNGFNIAGSDVFGRNGAGTRWSFPGGDTQGNSEFLLLYNPSAVTVPVTVTLYGSNGQTLSKTVSVPPTVRYNVDLSRFAPGFDPQHGAVVQSARGLGFVAEQTVFAPNHSTLRSTEGVAQ